MTASILEEKDAEPLPPAPFAELVVRSNFSFLKGASKPAELVQAAAAYGYDVIAITDRDGLYGSVRAMEEGKKRGVRTIVGCELTLEEWPDGGTEARRGNHQERATLTVLVENHEGYKHLCRILSESHVRHPKGEARKGDEGLEKNTYAGIPLAYVCEHAAGLWAIVHAPYHEAIVGPVAQAFGERASLALVRLLDGRDEARFAAARAASAKYGVPLLASGAVLSAVPEHRRLLDVLHCIREGLTLDEAGRALQPNAEAHLRPPAAMIERFADEPAAIARSRVVAEACRFSLTELAYKFPSEVGPGETPDQALRRLAYAGFEARLRHRGLSAEKLRELEIQVEKELAIIAELQVASYFLSVEGIVRIAREKDILCQGRGSAANSAVCYCLGVTAVDPARTNLLFERFLSAERKKEPPDIDVDFEHERREEVIQAIYERYGRKNAAMVSEIISYRGKSALREVGKVFGFSLEEVERLAGLVSWWDNLKKLEDARIASMGFDPNDGRVRMVLAAARDLQGYPRHLSIHVGGFVLSAEPLENVAPVEPATMKDRTVIPWDKDDLDTLGFFKVDVLGLGMLTALRKCLDFAQSRDPRLVASTAIERLDRIPAEDPVVYEALCHADTVGVFQIESRAQMAMLPRLKPRLFYDLVVEVAIVRPGPIQGGMIHPYLRRRNNEESIEPPHPLLRPILERTLGVPLFQEQVMQIAIAGAGYKPGEADQLRRDMAAWRKTGNLARHEQRLAEGFAKNGISAEFAARLYQQIHGFGEYGFPESHAASFALLVYASSWLKVHHPAAFAAALVNSQPMGFYSPSTLLQDAQRHGVEIRPVCIHASDWDCTLEGDENPAIRVGFRQVKGLGEPAGRRIEAARKIRAFASVEDLAARAALGRKELQMLAEAGALEPLVEGRREALWKVFAPRSEGLFAGLDLGDGAPPLPPMTRAQQLVLDYDRTGLSVGDHPMRVARPHLPKAAKNSRELQSATHGAPIVVAGMVICRQRPQTASGVVFVTMEDEHGFLNLIMYARVFEKLRTVATTSTLLLARGKVEREGEVVYVVVENLERLRFDPKEDVPAMSRDFH